MPILAAAREPAPDDEGEATPSTARGLKALAADRRVAFPKSQALAHLPLIPPAPPEADDFRSASKRSNSKPLPSDAIEDSPSSVHSGRSRDQSKTLDWRRRTTSKGKVQVLAVPEVAVPLQDDDIPGLPGVRESHVREAFNQIDFDGNGFIGVSELRYLLTVLGEEPTDAELDEMLAMIGGEGDGQAALEDFRMLFAPKSSVLAEMQTMAPEPEEEEIKQEKDDEQEEIPRLEAPPQQLGLLVKGAASFMQARIKKEDAGKKKASRARPKAKAPGSNRARPILGPPRWCLVCQTCRFLAWPPLGWVQAPSTSTRSHHPFQGTCLECHHYLQVIWLAPRRCSNSSRECLALGLDRLVLPLACHTYHQDKILFLDNQEPNSLR